MLSRLDGYMIRFSTSSSLQVINKNNMTTFQFISLTPGIVLYIVLSILAWKKKWPDFQFIWWMINALLAIILPLIAFKY